MHAKKFARGLMDIFSFYPMLEGTKKLMENAVNYRNTGHDGKGHEILNRWIKPDDFEDKFRYNESAFRTLQGKDHTYYVMDIDTLPDAAAFRMNTTPELRELRLRAAIIAVEEIRTVDDNFFNYLSGKGAYMIRKVFPNVRKEIFIDKTKKILSMCKEGHDKDQYCEQWHVRRGRREALFRWVTVDDYKFAVGVDTVLLKGDGARVFRLPYSPYPKIEGSIYICSPMIYDATGAINVAKSIKNTDPRFTEVFDYEIPEEHMDISAYEGIVIDTKAISTTDFSKHRNLEVKLSISKAYTALTGVEKAILRRIESDLTGEPSSTPPCMKNAYVKEMPDGHWNRVLIGRYLFNKGYTMDEIALFIRNKINDEEDNDDTNDGQMERNLSLFILPTDRNPKLVPSCAKLQNPHGTFYTCTPEDAIVCGRRNPMSKVAKTRATRSRAKAIKTENLIEKHKTLPTRIPGIGKYNKIVSDVQEIIKTPLPSLVKKTTRAGLTTSLVIAGHKEKLRTLVLVPTNRIAKQTFPDAVKIAKGIYKVDINGAVLSSNPKGCLKMMLLSEQLKERKRQFPEWGDSGVGLLKLPILMKPSCASASMTCEYFDNTIEMEDNAVITDSIVTRVGTYHTHSRGETRASCTKDHGDGLCARITVLRNMASFDTVFATYAKLMATLSSEGDEAVVALSEIKDYDVIMLDEVSTLLEGQPSIIEIAGRKGGKLFVKSDTIRSQLSILKDNLKKGATLGDLIEKGLVALESAVRGLTIAFIRGGVKTIVVKNPLDDRERKSVITQYAMLQNLVERTNVDMSLLGSFILALTESEWYLTAVTNMYSYTTISMVTKPELSLLRLFLKEAIKNGKKVIVTDASLPPMSMKALLHIEEWEEVDLGDPRGTNDLSLVIPDTKKVNISTLERSEDEQDKVIAFAEKIIERHGQHDLIVVMPNKGFTYKRMKKMFDTKYPDVVLTYFRSDQTVGVAHKRRTMLAVCKPLPPEDAFNWLATHYNREQGADVSATSEMLRQHSARQAFYQTIGRVKDPSAATPSVIYTYGTRKYDVQKLIGDYPSPVVIESPSSKIEYRLITGTHWRRTAELLSSAISAASQLIDERGRVTVKRLQKLMKESDFRVFMEQLSTHGYMFDEKKRAILSSAIIDRPNYEV